MDNAVTEGNIPPAPHSVSEISLTDIQKQHRIKPFMSFVIVIFFMIIITPIIIMLSKFTMLTQLHTTAQEFQLIESSPVDQDNAFSTVGQPTFVFSKNLGIPEKNLPQYFKISPNVSGTWHLEKNGQVVYFSSDKKQNNTLPNTFSYNVVYTLTVNKNLPSFDHQSLVKDVRVTFRTKQNPVFAMQANKKLIAVARNQPVIISFTFFAQTIPDNSEIHLVGSPVRVSITTATEQQLLHYFSYSKGKNPLYEFIPNATNTPIFQQEVILQSGSAQNTYQLPFGNTVFQKLGLYHVTVANDAGHEDLFVVVSNHINQIFTDSLKTYIWTTDQNTGISLPKVTAELFSVTTTPRLLDTVTTGDDGIAKSAQRATDVDFVITHSGDDMAITFTTSYGFNPFGIEGQNQYQVFSYSDRPVYQPGDTVHYKAVIRQKGNGSFTIPTGTIYAQFLLDYSSPGVNPTYKKLSIDANGTVTDDIQLPQMVTGAYPQITLSTKNDDGTYSQVDSLPLVVETYRKPDMDITAAALETEYISSDSTHVTVSAKTNYGQPLTNVDFSYRVLVNDYQEVKDRTTEDIAGAVSGYYGTGDELTTGNGRFNEKGQANITFSTNLPIKYIDSQIATLEITPHIGASPSIGKLAKLIHRGEFALFIDSLTGDTTNGISGSISVLNHHIPRAAIANQQVTVSLYKVIDDTTKQLVTSQPETSGVDGTAHFSFSSVDAGSYDVVVQGTDTRGNIVTASEQVTVGQWQALDTNQQYTLSLTSQKSSYGANDIATILVTANFTVNDAVIVLTNAGGSSANILSLGKNTFGSGTVAIPVQLQDAYGGNVGVDVYSVINGQVIGGHTDISINKPEKKIITSLSFDKPTYKPGDTVTAVITTKDQQNNPLSADTSLSVIDAALLQVGQLNGDIYDSFYGYTPYSIVSHYDSTTGIATELGGGGGGCFLGGTQITMKNGTMKNIEDVHVGDAILTRASDGSSKLVADTVIHTYKHAVTDYLTINNRLHITWIHRIFVNNHWEEAKDAKIGDILLDELGNAVPITSIVPHLGQFTVYNLTTSHYHTFFADGIYVHNDKGIGPRENFVDTAYWNPHIQTDVTGNATISFPLPDNLTTYTAQIIANTKDAQFGQTVASFVSQKDISIIPALANFYFQGDKPILSARIQNSSRQDVSLQVKLSSKELGMTKAQSLFIHTGDFGTVTFPATINTKTTSLSFFIEAKDSQGNTVDSLLVKRPVLPKGSLITSWRSFQGSKNITFASAYPSLDFNTITLSVVPNIINKLFHNYVYFDDQPTSNFGKDLYAYAYILAKTRDGEIAPTSYQYATLRNDFRDAVATVMQQRGDTHWNLPSDSGTDSLAEINLWTVQGLSQAASVHLLDEIQNLPEIISRTEQYVQSNTPISPVFLLPFQKNQAPAQITPYSTEEKIARQWVLHTQFADESYQNTPTAVAIQALLGDTASLAKLRNLRLPSASDRYLWDGNLSEDATLPVLAMVEKGTQQDAERAIKGISFTTTDDVFALLAGVKYAERKNFYIEEPSIQVMANNQLVYTTKIGQYNGSFTQTFLTKNLRDGKINLAITVKSSIPVYSTIIQTVYTDQQSADQKNNTAASFINQFMQQVGLGTVQQVTMGNDVDLHLSRIYKDLQTGANISSIAQGKAGVVTLSAINEFPRTITDTSHYSNLYGFMIEDALSPAYIYLNQTSGNSPQFQSSLDHIFTKYIVPSDYSDEAVFFNNASVESNLILPYTVYTVAEGSYYQPKTSIVFPILGLLSVEK